MVAGGPQNAAKTGRFEWTDEKSPLVLKKVIIVSLY
jgi:hypothetical protein